jgi:outer membrane protein assembly factor BamA
MKGITCALLLLSFHFIASGQVEESTIKVNLGRKGRFAVFPLLVKSPEYKWGGGAGGIVYVKLRNDSITRTSHIKAVSFYTLRQQFVFASEGNIYFPKDRYILRTTLSFTHFPDKFWGLGNDTENDAVENYAITQYNFSPQFLKKIYSYIYAGVYYEFQNVFQFSYTPNGLFDTEDVVGKNGGIISGLGYIISWDSRNNAFSPSKGFYLQFVSGQYDKRIGSDFNFALHNLDVRKYFPLKKDRVLALQFNLISTHGSVPIRNLTNIGSNSYMRGYYEGRFADKNLIAIQSELRTPLVGKFGAVVFTGVGRVGSSFSQLFQMTNLKPCIGLGFRYAINQKEKLNLRLDAGFGKKSHGSYINMGEAF